MRKAAAWAIVAGFAGYAAELQAAGPFRPVAWWRIPVTGAIIVTSAGALNWAGRELARGSDGAVPALPTH